MAAPGKITINLRPVHKEIGGIAQDQMLARYVAEHDVHGLPLAVNDEDTLRQRGKLRVRGPRVALREIKGQARGFQLGREVRESNRTKRGKVGTIRLRLKSTGGRHTISKGQVGVDTGRLLRDMNRRSLVKASRRGFIVVPPRGQRHKLMWLNIGTKRQPKRPVGGFTSEFEAYAARRIAREARDQVVEQLRAQRRPFGSKDVGRELRGVESRRALAVDLGRQAIEAKLAAYDQGLPVAFREGAGEAARYRFYPQGGDSPIIDRGEGARRRFVHDHELVQASEWRDHPSYAESWR